MSQEDLDAILATAMVKDAVTGNPRLIDLNVDTLNLYNLSTIYRYTVLSKALKYKVPDFCLLTKLFQAAPFSVWNGQTGVFDDISPEATVDFWDLAEAIKKNGFKPVVLQYIFSGELPADSTLGLDSEKARLTVKIIRDTFLTIDQDHPDTPAGALTTDILRGKLSLTFSGEIVQKMMDIIEGTATFSTITTGNLVIAIPANLASKYSYIKGSGRLMCTGIMTDAERVTLKGIKC